MFSQNFSALIDFIKAHSLFFIKTLIVLTFFVERLIVRDFALKQILWVVIITLVTLFMCERKFKVNEEPIKYFNLLFFLSTWVGLLLFFFWGILYYYALNFPLLELSTEAQGLVAQGLNWRIMIQLIGNLILIIVIITLNLESKPKKLLEYPGEERFERKVRERVQGKMWIWTHKHWIERYEYALAGLFSSIVWAKIFNIKVPYIIEHDLFGYMCMNYIVFLLGTFLRLFYIIIKTTLREEEIAARKKK